MTSFLTWVLFLTAFLMSENRLNFGRALYNRRACRPQMMHDDPPVILSKFKVRFIPSVETLTHWGGCYTLFQAP